MINDRTPLEPVVEEPLMAEPEPGPSKPEPTIETQQDLQQVQEGEPLNETWLMAQNRDDYTIQVIALSSKEKLIALIMPENSASIKVAEKLGMIKGPLIHIDGIDAYQYEMML